MSARVSMDQPLTTYVNGVSRSCRAIELNCNGALIQRPSRGDPPLVQAFELELSRGRRLRSRARTVWAKEGLHAVRFIGLSDVDRLDIAELIDGVQRRFR